MKNYRINYADETIIISKEFAKKASVFNSEECKKLLEVKQGSQGTS